MIITTVQYTVLTTCRSRWGNGYRACHWTQGSRVQIRPSAMDFNGNKIRLQDLFQGGEDKAVGSMS
jgi:hypothetical protein